MNDNTLTAIFVAFRDEHATSLDKMLADPDLRQPFLQDARQALGPVPEKDILGRLIHLRKRSLLPTAGRRGRS